eukprot:364251-Chlamydomonas_euryale.AAC.4
MCQARIKRKFEGVLFSVLSRSEGSRSPECGRPDPSFRSLRPYRGPRGSASTLENDLPPSRRSRLGILNTRHGARATSSTNPSS